jgi:hypothetical protein
MPHAYSKEEMTHQAVTLSACSGRSCVEQLCHLMVSVGTMFLHFSLSLSLSQFKYILHPFSCKANLQLTQNRMACSILFSPDVHKGDRRHVSCCQGLLKLFDGVLLYFLDHQLYFCCEIRRRLVQINSVLYLYCNTACFSCVTVLKDQFLVCSQSH